MKYITTLLIGITLFLGCASKQKSSLVTAQQAVELIDKESNLQIVDVRTPGEYAEGHIANSTNIDIYDFEVFENEINKLSKEKPVFVYCRSGGRSADAVSQLLELGFEEVYDLDGGITKWMNAGLQTVKD